MEVLVVWECETADFDLLSERLMQFWFGKRSKNNAICVQETYGSTNVGKIVRTTHSNAQGEFKASIDAVHTDPSGDLMGSFDLAWLRSRCKPWRKTGNKSKRIADLFCGCGAMTLGVVEAVQALNFTPIPILAIDNDPFAIQAFSANFPTADTINNSIENILTEELGSEPSGVERDLRTAVGDIDVIVGGPPCQGHSDLNNHTRRADPRNALLLKIVRAAELWLPDAIMIENVQGIRHDSERVVSIAEGHLSDMGYSVNQSLIEMSILGIPQRRRRFLLVASKSRAVDISYMVQAFATGPRTVRWACEDLETNTGLSVLHSPSNASPWNRQRIDYLFNNDLHDLPDSERPRCHRVKPHRYKSAYGRMYWDAPSQTITSGFGCMGQGRFVHPSQRRTITPREAARLQFIPDFFEFATESRTALARMIANAVPPRLSYVLTLGLLG